MTAALGELVELTLPMTPAAAAWLAGLCEGEATFDAPRGNPRIRVKMVDLDVVLRAWNLMGGTVTSDTWAERNRGHQPLWVATVHGDRAVELMLELLPWLGSRRSARVGAIVAAHELKRKAALTRARAA